MNTIKKLVAIACVGASIGATFVVFAAPADGSAKFRGYCNHGVENAKANGGAANATGHGNC